MSLATFKGGIHPPDMKELSMEMGIETVAPPKTLVIPLSQHIGAPCSAQVEIGQEVKAGQVIGSADAFVSAPVHSSVSGKVVAMGQFPNAMGRMVECVVIENDGEDNWAEFEETEDYLSLEPGAIKEKRPPNTRDNKRQDNLPLRPLERSLFLSSVLERCRVIIGYLTCFP